MIPKDKKWAIGVIISIIVFFLMIVLAGRAYLIDIDEEFTLDLESPLLEGDLRLWIVRNDSKNTPIKVHPTAEDGGRFSKFKVDIQREFIAENSMMTIQVRSPKSVTLSSSSPPNEARLDVEVMHTKVASHQPVLVIEASGNATRSTEVYVDEITPRKVFSDTKKIEIPFQKPLFGSDYEFSIREDIYELSGKENFWEITTYDSINKETVKFNGMALFKIRLRLFLDLEDGTSLSSDWMETQYFAIDLVSESP